MVRKITEQLFVGDKDDAKNLIHKFDIIVSLSHPPDESTEEFVIPDGPHDYTIFEDAVNYTVSNLNKGNMVLIHCQAGISRSVSVCIAAHSTYYNSDYNTSYNKCKHDIYHPSIDLINSTKKYLDII